ncbi:uncharacterized protein LOC126234568 [Schistocerca nitens]|uniref:uncharacterized protein LOC126234568 n=1 Tax=Schistocerca nitens TaxID=7011 RepID=UPI00211785DB|nr:uncharacterized protein LOC126234568 [Schistocerca nitens]
MAGGLSKFLRKCVCVAKLNDCIGVNKEQASTSGAITEETEHLSPHQREAPRHSVGVQTDDEAQWSPETRLRRHRATLTREQRQRRQLDFLRGAHDLSTFLARRSQPLPPRTPTGDV